MSEKTIFSQIIDRELPSEIVFENEQIIVIKSIHPLAPVHLLGITKVPFKSIDALLADAANKDLLWELMERLHQIAHELGIAESGYRLSTNVGPDAGQTIPHLHIHLMGGSELRGDALQE